ncbi:MAG: hypothetical protein IKS04_01645 [Clostridia bacterium]|nr:hypothetical protein [Clostridia bacterium]
MIHKILAVLAIVIAVALTVFLLLKDEAKRPNLKAFGCSAPERDRFLNSPGYRIYLGAKRITFLKREGVIFAMLAVSVIFTITIRARKSAFDSVCIASLIPAAVFLTVMLYYLIVFLKKDPAALTLGKIGEMMIVGGKNGSSGRVKAKVTLRSGMQCEACCPGLKAGKENNQEHIRSGEICFVFVTGANEIFIAADRAKKQPVEPSYDKPQAVNLNI